MSTTLTRVSVATPTRTTPIVRPSTGPVAAPPQLTSDLDRLRAEEQNRINRERQADLARLQELARFD